MQRRMVLKTCSTSPDHNGKHPPCNGTDARWMTRMDTTEYDRNVYAYLLTHYLSWKKNIEEFNNEYASSTTGSDGSC